MDQSFVVDLCSDQIKKLQIREWCQSWNPMVCRSGGTRGVLFNTSPKIIIARQRFYRFHPLGCSERYDRMAVVHRVDSVNAIRCGWIEYAWNESNENDVPRGLVMDPGRLELQTGVGCLEIL
ncbi:hypothetical protein VN12_25380 [Pirellula sp. SH-Sr6A]|nr:hypothetical protein VN12_25380 [Pirellula sp. SH-Sr6A]